MKLKPLFICLLCFISTLAFASDAYAQFRTVRENLEHNYTVEFIRVFYDTEGEHAIAPDDENENRVPDQVEDVAKQIWAAHKIFVDTLGFTAPLDSERYQAAKFIDVNLLSKDTIKLRGIAYDGLQSFNRKVDGEVVRTLCIDISSSINANSNHTPTHEYFHLIQNGATYFKTRWYTEGMARWSEHAIAKGGLGEMRYESKAIWPQTNANQAELFKMTYDSEFYLWNPLCNLDDRSGRISRDDISGVVQKLKYANGDRVLKDYKLNAPEFIRDVLVELGKLDDVAFKELGYEKWSEDNQKSVDNSPYIYQAIMNVARARGHKIGEFKAGE